MYTTMTFAIFNGGYNNTCKVKRFIPQMEELQKMDDLHDELTKKEEELKNARQVIYVFKIFF